MLQSFASQYPNTYFIPTSKTLQEQDQLLADRNHLSREGNQWLGEEIAKKTSFESFKPIRLTLNNWISYGYKDSLFRVTKRSILLVMETYYHILFFSYCSKGDA